MLVSCLGHEKAGKHISRDEMINCTPRAPRSQQGVREVPLICRLGGVKHVFVGV